MNDQYLGEDTLVCYTYRCMGRRGVTEFRFNLYIPWKYLTIYQTEIHALETYFEQLHEIGTEGSRI